MKTIVRAVKNSFLFPILKPVADWLHPQPPSDVEKRETIIKYGKQYNIDTFVETGTFQGGTVDYVKNHFSKVYSIELSDELYRQAVEKFKEFPHIKIIHGNSSDELKKLLPLPEPILFWLDAHYSSGVTAKGDLITPILDELQIIFKTCRNPVILIDDARDFEMADSWYRDRTDYPSIKVVKKMLPPEFKLVNKNGIIRITK